MMKAKKLVDSKRIRARMIMLGLRNRDLAKAWGCAEQTASQKLNGTRPLSLEETRRKLYEGGERHVCSYAVHQGLHPEPSG